MGAAPRRARPRPAGRLAHPARGRHQGGAQGDAGERCATTCAACCAKRASAIPGSWCAATASRCASAKGQNSSQAQDKLQTLSQPLGGILERHRPPQHRHHQRAGRPVPADADRSGDCRARAPGGRPVDRDHRTARQRARHRRAAHPARRHRPHSGAGARPAGSDPAEGTARQDRQARLPHGRRHGVARAGAAGPACRRTTKSSTAPARTTRRLMCWRSASWSRAAI